MKIDPNAPAYPQPLGAMAHESGIPIRLAIAAQIMAGMAANSDLSASWLEDGRSIKEVASNACVWADALIAAHDEEAA